MSVPRRAAAFGRLLRAHRLAAGLTQEILAERAGLSPRTVQLLEADRARPRPDTAARLARALSLSAPDLQELERAVVPAPRRRLSERHDGTSARHDASNLGAAPILSLRDAGSHHTLVPLPRPVPTNLPWPVSNMVGRESGLASVHDLVAVDHQRLVTLVGVGGAGKTRLGVQVAAELLNAFPDGVWYVELAPTSSPELVPRVVAGALGVREVSDVPMLETLIGFLRRKSLLLVLDNCEHLIDACAALADRLLTACPDLHILATSREPLRVTGERRWRVQPLAVPKSDDVASFDALAGTASVRLFVERAQAIDADFRLTEANAAAVGQICVRLDGIPLAIELAASKIDMLAVGQITERLDDCFQVLAGGSRSAPTRQQTMQAALRWSYDLLTSAEQFAFRTLSTFAGGFDLEAAEGVGWWGRDDVREATSPAPPIIHHPAPITLDVLSRLVDKSLVVSEQATQGRRYRLLEPVRQYAHRLLAAAGEEQDARSRHAAYFAGLAERTAPLPRGPEQIDWLDRLEAERDNLRAALSWITEHGRVDDGLRLAVALAPYWEARGYLSEGRHWLEAVLAASRVGDVSPALQMRALLATGTLARWQRDLPPADALLSEALEAARNLTDRRSEAEALGGLASVYRHLDAVERALLLSEEGVRLGRELDDEPTLAAALLHNGMALGAQGLLSGTRDEVDRAVSVLEECVMRFRRLGDVRHIAIAATVLGRTLRLTGDHARAAALLREAVLTLGAIGDQANLVDALGGLAHAAMALGELRQAAHCLAASRALRHALGMRYSARNTAYDLSIHDALLGQMAASEFDEAYARGAAMSLDQVVAEIGAEQ